LHFYARTNRGEAKGLDLDIPLPRWEVHSITPVLVGVGYQLGFGSLRIGRAGGYHGSGQELIGGTNRAGVLRGGKQRRKQRGYEAKGSEAMHGNL
jgi:hypothetical protein